MENIKKWSTENTMYINTEETKTLIILLPEKGYNISYVRKQQAYNYAITPQTSPKYRITNYRVSSLIKILALKHT